MATDTPTTPEPEEKNAIEYVIMGIYFKLANLKDDLTEAAKKQIWDRIKMLIFVNLTVIALIIATVCINNDAFSIVAAIFSSVLVLITWYAGEVFTKFLKSLKSIPGVSAAGDELQNIFFPLCTLSLVMAFVAFWISVNGAASLKTKEFAVIFTAIFFFFIFMVYTKSKTRWAGYLMMFLVAIMLFQKALPDYYRCIHRVVYSKGMAMKASADRGSIKNQADAKATYANVIESGTFYQMDGLNVSDKKAVLGQQIMIIDIKEDIKEGPGEPMYTVQLKNADGIFLSNGIKYKFPARRLGKFQVVSDLNKPAPPPPPRQKELKTVFKREYTGRGFDNDQHVLTAEFGTDIKLNDEIIARGNNIEVWHRGTWEKCDKQCEMRNENGTSGKLAVKSKPGNIIEIEVKRLI